MDAGSNAMQRIECGRGRGGSRGSRSRRCWQRAAGEQQAEVEMGDTGHAFLMRVKSGVSSLESKREMGATA